MEDFKIIFYIAIGIAWVVYKNYLKVQQNRPKTDVPTHSDTRTASAEKKPAVITLEKTRQEKQTIAPKVTQFKKDFTATKQTKWTKPVLKDEIKKKVPSPSPFPDTDIAHKNIQANATKKEVEINKEAKKYSEEDLFDLKKFDIRTAIIYSEILKRPYV